MGMGNGEWGMGMCHRLVAGASQRLAAAGASEQGPMLKNRTFAINLTGTVEELAGPRLEIGREAPAAASRWDALVTDQWHNY
ncbi:hypothetical protein BH09SUM1_BH09SUM1_15710 [soil metagenome]